MRTATPESVVDTDICIIGAGPAGVTLALEMAGSGRRICLVDSGGLDASGDAVRGPIDDVGRPYRTEREPRAFRFGGTSGLWGGHCVPLSPIEMEARDWVPGGAWPISHAELARHYPRALEILDLAGADFDAAAAARAIGAPLLPFGEGFTSTVSHYNPMDFGKDHGPALAAAGTVTILLNATATRLLLDDDLERTTGTTLRTEGGVMHQVRAKTVVLAAGGIENARLLLASNEQIASGVGNGNDLVGRYFMEHPGWTRGVIVPGPAYDLPRDYAHYWRQVPLGGHEIRFHLAATNEMARRLRVPQFRAELFCRPLLGWAMRSVLMRPGSHDLPTMLEAAAQLARHPAGLARMALGRRGAPWCLHIHNYTEQIPNRESRVMLSARRDALGEPLAALDWRLSPADRDGIARVHQALATSVAGSGLGHLIPEPESGDAIMKRAGGGSHHMGTTRMSESPRKGVVDADLKVHGVRNLYVAGSSVFPSGGWANPTLTIVALSVRLAAHLRRTS